VTTSGYSTIYTFARDHVAVTSLFAKSSARSKVGAVRWTITVGSQGEVSASTLQVTAKGSTTDVSVAVLSYNQSVVVTPPPSSQLKPLSASAIDKVLMSASLHKFLVPRELTSLGQEKLS
jgi:hypothetical protein